MTSLQQLCTFRVGPLFLGLDVLLIQEVLRARELARVPRAPATVEGLLNLRGQIVTAIDLRRRFGFEPRTTGDEPMFMIVRGDDGQIALIVDSVGDVIAVDASTFELAPETMRGEVARLIAGVHKLPGSLLHVLDADAAVAEPETVS